MTDTAPLRRALVVFLRVAQFLLAAMAGLFTLTGIGGDTNVILALAFGVFALVMLAFAGVLEVGVRYVRPPPAD